MLHKETVSDVNFPATRISKFSSEGSDISASLKAEIIKALVDALTKVEVCNRPHRRLIRKAVQDFLHFFEQSSIKSIVIDESLLDHYLSHLKRQGYSKSVCEKRIGYIRFVFNRFLYPLGFIQRPMGNLLTYRKNARLYGLSPHTIKAVQWFKQSGSRTKSSPVFIPFQGILRKSSELVTTGKPLSIQVIKTRINRLIKFLGVVQKADIREVNSDDCKAYVSYYTGRGQKDLAHKDLGELMSVFQNFKEAGFISENPLLNIQVPICKSNAVIDFLTQESIAELSNLDTLNWNNSVEVRNRLIALLLYDLALRRIELWKLQTTDIRIENEEHILLTIRSEIQKGEKPEVQFFLFFPATRKVLLYYLNKSRLQLKPKDDHLLISVRGEPLSYTHVGRGLKEVCDQLRIKTFKGKEPAPHIFRHSFATLNISPLGLRLPLHDVVDRLRHIGYEVAKKHYIHNNYYLKKEKLKHYISQGNNELCQLSTEDVKTWLKSLSVSERTTSEVAEKIKQARERVKTSGSEWVSENEALKRLGRFNLSKKAIRSFFKNSGNCRGAQDGRKVICWYPKDIVEELDSNYETPSRIMNTLNIQRSTLYKRLDSFKSLKIGRKLLIQKGSIVL